MFGIDDAVTAGLTVVNKVIDRAWPDPIEAAKQKLEAENAMRQAFQQWDQGQTDTNKAEAASSSMFVAGWRPGIGWVCALALFYQYLLRPLGTWAGFALGHPIPEPPALDDSLWQLMFGMLGLGGLRTYEKLKGVATAPGAH